MECFETVVSEKNGVHEVAQGSFTNMSNYVHSNKPNKNEFQKFLSLYLMRIHTHKIRMIKNLGQRSHSPRQTSVDYGNTKKPSCSLLTEG